ncbi:MAG TPA: alpha/beta fold hydrolase [Gammaproteobacteria bacterium]|jgi:medium-chain acyl-[acyl-carrier-protein] hydrolase|nr:alpha/beta fold hydrolase [Gammaproteobacteria bacterium]
MHDKWFVLLNKAVNKLSKQLILFHHAGGTAYSFSKFAKQFDSSTQIVAVELPGRGVRLNELPENKFDSLIKKLIEALMAYLNPNAIFLGHSMGALIAYECAKKLENNYQYIVDTLIISGQGAPCYHTKSSGYLNSQATDEELILQLKKIKGFPDGAEEYPDLLKMILENIRTDCELLASYNYQSALPLSCPLICLIAEQDGLVSHNQYKKWQIETKEKLYFCPIPGDHFALLKEYVELPRLLSSIKDAENI